jgi:hypothetical protein
MLSSPGAIGFGTAKHMNPDLAFPDFLVTALSLAFADADEEPGQKWRAGNACVATMRCTSSDSSLDADRADG